MVELAVSVVASADQGEHIPGMRIESHQRHLGRRPGENPGLGLGVLAFADFHLTGAKFCDLLIHLADAHRNRFSSSFLQRGIKGGVDAVSGAVQIVFSIFREQLLADEIDKIGSIAGFHVLGGQLQRSSFSGICLGAAQNLVFNHGFQHQVAAFHGALRMAVRRKIAGSLNDSSEQGRFRKSDVFQILAEIGLGRFAEAGNGKRATLAHIDLVGVELENLLFGEALLQFNGNQDLDHLALDLLLTGKEEATGHLHGDGRAALLLAAFTQIDPAGFHEPPVVDAAVMEEAAVFDGGDGIHHDLGNVVILYQPLLGALLAVKEAGHKLRLKLVGGKLVLGIPKSGNLLYFAFMDTDNRAFRVVVGVGAGLDLNGCVQQLVGAKLGFALFTLFGIARMTEIIGNLANVSLLSDPDTPSLGVNLRGVGEDLATHPLVYDLLVLDVVVREYAEQDGANNDERRHSRPYNRVG